MRVVVLGAGGPAGVNTCRALAAAGHEVVATDSNPDHLGWGERVWESACMPEYSVEAINELEPDFVLPQPDGAVAWLVSADGIEAATFLPDQATVLACQVKSVAQSAWFDAGLTSGAYVIGDVDDLYDARGLFGMPFWLRAISGAGARCALNVESMRQAYHWVTFWRLRGVSGFMAEEYLPGRDFAWTGIYWHGQLVTSFLRERLEYLYPHLTPTGLTGTPTRARIVHDSMVNLAAEAAVEAVANEPHGIMSVDLKEDRNGAPRPTEINAGRGFTTLGLWSLYDPTLNFLDMAAILSRGGYTASDVRAVRSDLLPEGLTLHRHIDAGHRFTLEPAFVSAVGGDPE